MLERIGPDPVTIRLTKIILDQNAKVLEMNARLLISISSPAFLVPAGGDVAAEEQKPK